MCARAKKIRNQANYQIRQALFSGKPISHSDADKLIKTQQRDLYELLASAASQRIIQVLGQDWKGWFEASKSYKKNPSKFKGRPKLPGYSKSAATVVIGRNGFAIKDGELRLLKQGNVGFHAQKIKCVENQIFNQKKDLTEALEVRFVPLGSCYVLEVVYRKAINDLKLNPNNAFGIDLGIDNLLSIVSNQQGIAPVLIKGKVIKSINQQYNKNKAKLASRNKHRHIKALTRKRFCRINDYFHKVSHWLIQEAIETDTGTLVVGTNPDWKTSINIGKQNNQKFVSIPYRSLISKIKYKAELVGIKVIEREESHTSKASAVDFDVIPNTFKDKPESAFSGKRVKRGLYKTKSGQLINADVNGAANILRKEIGNAWLAKTLNEGAMDAPRTIKHIDLFLEGCHRAAETPSKLA